MVGPLSACTGFGDATSRPGHSIASRVLAGREVALHLNARRLLELWEEQGWPVERVSAFSGIPESTLREQLSPRRIDASGFRFDDHRQVVRSVMAALPETSVVFPTERYFYFEFDSDARRVSGNLRFTDIPEVVWTGFFDRFDGGAMGSGGIPAGPAPKGEAAIEVSAAAGGQRVEIGLHARGEASPALRRSFLLPDAWLRAPSGMALREGERFVSGILDESGFGLVLAYHEASGSFFYTLRDDAPLPDELVAIESRGVRFLVGQRSRFVFLVDDSAAPSRRVLVGVSEQEVRANSFYDGPFDQVPPKLPIGAMLERAYPYVLARGGIDAHGNFLGLDHQRVAISPYQQYVDSPRQACERLATMLSESKRSPAWLEVIWEDKRTFHEHWSGTGQGPYAAAPYSHATATSLSWPANHWGTTSRTWPSDHAQRSSLGWPPSHEAARSTTTPKSP
jgi:hypothetical protein